MGGNVDEDIISGLEDILKDENTLKDIAVFLHSRLANSRYGKQYQELLDYFKTKHSFELYTSDVEHIRDSLILNNAFTRELRRYLKEKSEEFRKIVDLNTIEVLWFNLAVSTTIAPKIIEYIVDNKELIETLAKNVKDQLPYYARQPILLGRLKQGETVYDLIHRGVKETCLPDVRTIDLTTVEREDSKTRIGLEAFFHKDKKDNLDANHTTFILRQDSNFDAKECSELLSRCLEAFNSAEERTYYMHIHSDVLSQDYQEANIFSAHMRIQRGFWGSLKQINQVDPQGVYTNEDKFAEVLDILGIPYKVKNSQLKVKQKQPKDKLITHGQIVQAYRLALEKGFHQVEAHVWSYPDGRRKGEEESFMIEESREEGYIPTKFDVVGRKVYLRFARFGSAKENIQHGQEFVREQFGINFNEFEWQVKDYLLKDEPQDLDESPFDGGFFGAL